MGPHFFAHRARTGEQHQTFFMYDESIDAAGTDWNWHRLYHEPDSGHLQWRRTILVPAEILRDLHERLNAVAMEVE